jgi:predicted enzyme related to lactoylglutathione lyase
MATPVMWFEVTGKDGKQLRRFYGELFNWKFQMAPDANTDYGLVAKEQTGIGGGVGAAPQGAGWVTFYVGVPDVAEALRRAESLGAKVLMPVTKLPDTTIAVFADPEGHPVGICKA